MSSIPPRRPEPTAAAMRPEAELAILRGVLDAAPARVCVISRDRRYLYVNREFAEFAGRSVEEILTMTTTELVGPDLAARLTPVSDRALAGETVTFEGWVDYRKNGRRYISYTFAPYGGPEGQSNAFINYMRDLTDIKRREEE